MNEVKTIFDFNKWRQVNDISDADLSKYVEWIEVKLTINEESVQCWYLRLDLRMWEQVAISDFRFKFKSD
jgi:hypothetical protein